MSEPPADTEQAQEASAAPVDLAASPDEIATRIEEIDTTEAAEVMYALSPEKAAAVFEALDPITAARIMTRLNRMNLQRAAEALAAMEPPEAAMVLAAMNPDDRVDILGHVPQPLHDALISELEHEHRAEVRHLEQYPPDTAGGIMTSQVTALYEYITVENAIQLLRRLNEELEQMYYVYVINRRGQLVGVLSMRDLILARPEAQLYTIMIKSVRAVPATMDQEQVAALMRSYGYLAVPVVDENNVLLGLITLDDVIDVIQDEATEDFQRMFGAGAEERLSSSWFYSFRKRVGWLQMNLGTAFLAAAIVSLFNRTIEVVPILAAYQTVVSALGGNAGAQSLVVAIRGIATGEADRATLSRALRRQLLVGLCSGISVGITAGIIAAIFNFDHHGVVLGFVVFASLLFNLALASVSGLVIPFVLRRFGFDPAQSSSIICTAITDCGGFFACLGLATLLLDWLK